LNPWMPNGIIGMYAFKVGQEVLSCHDEIKMTHKPFDAICHSFLIACLKAV